VGAVSISPSQVVAILAHHAGLDVGVDFSPQQDAVLWSIRLPRVVLGALVGAGLAISGAALQGIFRNPLADPQLIGVSGGASLGAAAAIVWGFVPLGLWSLPVAAFATGRATTLVVYSLARFEGRTEVVTLLLTGLALNAMALAGVGMFAFMADDEQLRDIVFWSLGSVGGATWDTVVSAAVFIAAALVLLPLLARPLNLMVLGEREARHLGVDGDHRVRRPDRAPPRAAGRRPRPPPGAPGQRARRGGPAAARRPRRPYGRLADRASARRAHRADRQPVLPLAGAPHAPGPRGLGVTGTLETRGLSYHVDGRALVEEIDLTVAAGELLAVVGPNGAGKSTLVGLLAGDLRASAGEVRLSGRPVGAYRPRELARLRSVLPQQTVLSSRSPWSRW